MQRQAWCLVPVKRLGSAKQRLAGALTPGQRVEFARLMAMDVIRAARKAACLAGVAVVTADEDISALARGEGAAVLAETEIAGLNAALEHGAAELAVHGASTILIVPADVPLVTADDIAAMLEGHAESPAMTIARAASDGGSNAIAVTPPGVMPFCFGEGSFERHCRAARAAGIEPRTPQLARLALDIDKPSDLDRLLSLRSRSLAADYLSTIVFSPKRVSHDA